jgi:tryptophan synthase alpha chain
MGVTGMRSNIVTDLAGMVAKVRAAAKLPVAKLPVAVGFGIHSPMQAAEIGKIADGVIVGSAIVKIIEEHGGEAGPRIYQYVKEMKEAVS